MKKILIVGDFLKGSGLTKFIMNIFPKINSEQLHFDVINIGGNDDYLNEVSDLGWHMYTITPANQNLVLHLKEWNSLLKRIGKQYDAIHFNYSALWNFVPILLAKRYGIKHIIMHSHNTYFSNNPSNNLSKLILTVLHKLGMKIAKHTCSGYFACSDLAAKWFYPKSLIAQGNIKIIKNGIDVNKFTFNEQIRKRLRSELNVDDKMVLGHIGVFESRKNHKFLINTFEKIHQKNNASILILVGKGALQKEIENMILQKDLGNSVKLLGLREDIPELMQAFDAFIFPSLFEGLGIVMIEAQAAGLICFASDKIPQEAYITSLAHSISLTRSTEYWADIILKNTREYQRIDRSTEIIRQGYSSVVTADFLRNYYGTI